MRVESSITNTLSQLILSRNPRILLRKWLHVAQLTKKNGESRKNIEKWRISLDQWWPVIWHLGKGGIIYVFTVFFTCWYKLTHVLLFLRVAASTKLQSWIWKMDKQQNLPPTWVMRKRFHWELVKPSLPGPAADENKRKRPCVSDFRKAI